MAIGAGSIVAVKINSAGLTLGNVTNQPPAFGVAEGTAPYTVDWGNNGSRVTGILATSLDEILNASTPNQALLGQVVSIAEASAAFNGLVVGVYSRSGIDVVLTKNLQTGAFVEIAASEAVLVPGL